MSYPRLSIRIIAGGFWRISTHHCYRGDMPASMVTRDPLTTTPAFFGPPAEVAPDVFMHPVFVNSYALRTPAGLALIDPGFGETSDGLKSAVRAWSDAPLRVAGVAPLAWASAQAARRAYASALGHPGAGACDCLSASDLSPRSRRSPNRSKPCTLARPGLAGS